MIIMLARPDEGESTPNHWATQGGNDQRIITELTDFIKKALKEGSDDLFSWPQVAEQIAAKYYPDNNWVGTASHAWFFRVEDGANVRYFVGPFFEEVAIYWKDGEQSFKVAEMLSIFDL